MTARGDGDAGACASRSTSGADRPTGWMRLDLDGLPGLAPWLLGLVVVTKFALAAGFNYTVFSVPPSRSPVFGPIVRATWGLVTPQLLVGLFQLGVLVGGLVWLVGGIHPVHVGLDREDLSTGVSVTLAFWVVVQAVGLVVAGASGTVTLSPLWQAIGARGMLSNLLAEVFGTAPMEESIYRGLFLTQGYLLARRVVPDRRTSLVLAVLGSQVLFALAHVPARLVVGTQLGLPLGQDLLLTFVLGLIFALVYLRTGNLFVAMGVHVLSNDPTSLFLQQPTARVLVGLCVLVLLVGWPRLRRLGQGPDEDAEVDGP